MKKMFVIVCLAVCVFAAYFALRQPVMIAEPLVSLPMPSQTTNILPRELPAVAPTSALNTNTFMRPDYIDLEQWNRLMFLRQTILEQNQPVEFYARIIDQSEQPIEGAKLTLKLTRIDEKIFSTTNFFHRQMGDEVQVSTIILTSDKNGWIQAAKTNGYFLDMVELFKNGYVSDYPSGNFGGVHYEARGERNTYGGDILMTNALNPKKGYILHLKKQ
jgi:hypothetical protein